MKCNDSTFNSSRIGGYNTGWNSGNAGGGSGGPGGGGSGHMTTVGQFFDTAASTFRALPMGASQAALNAQCNTSSHFRAQGLNLETGHQAAKVESDHLLNLPREKIVSTADRLAYVASRGGGFAPRNLASRMITSVSADAYKGNNAQEQKQLDMHYNNLVRNPHYQS